MKVYSTRVEGESVTVLYRVNGWVRVRFDDGREKSYKEAEVGERLLRSVDHEPATDTPPSPPETKKTPKKTSRSTPLDGLDLEGCYKKAAKILGMSVASLREKYGHLNPGLQRMNLGNRVRSKNT